MGWSVTSRSLTLLNADREEQRIDGGLTMDNNSDAGHAKRFNAGRAPRRSNARHTQPKDNLGRPDDCGAGRMFDGIAKAAPVKAGQ